VDFTTNGGYVRGLDLETGRLVWTDYPIDYFRPYSETHASPAVGDGVLVVPGKWGDGLIAYESA
jgi:hypothetical protein